MGVVNALQQQLSDRNMDNTAANATRYKGDFVMYALGLLMISRQLIYVMDRQQIAIARVYLPQ